MNKAIPTNHFKKQCKKVEKNSRWHSIFHEEVPLPDDHYSSWEYVISCFLNSEPIPDYFYEHSVTLIARQKNQIKGRLGSLSQVKIKGLNLYFSDHNGDHLLLYTQTNQGAVYSAGIRTHSDLF